MRKRYGTPGAAALVLTALAAAGLAFGAEDTRPLFTFETGTSGWGLGPQRSTLQLDTRRATEGRRSLLVPVAFPGETGVETALSGETADWSGFRRLAFDVFVPAGAPGDIQVMAWVKDADLYYYHNLHVKPLEPGKWNTVLMDITPQSLEWQYVDHYKPWDGYERRSLSEMGLRFLGRTAFRGALLIDNVHLDGREPGEEPNEIYNLRVNTVRPGRYEKLEISFNLRRTYANPFDPDVVDVTARFLTPGGRVVSVPGFFYQGFLRQLDKRTERLIPMGRSLWKVRFCPTELGRYSGFIEVRDGQTVRSRPIDFECVESRSRGFIRVSHKDAGYFEFDSGDFYYPIGHNIAATGDTRAAPMGVSVAFEEGTFAYDRFLDQMSRNGENWGRIWMSPWSFGIEWTHAYGIHYHGAGRYNLENSWRLDHVLQTAGDKGIYLMILFTGHGEVGDYESDFYSRRPQQGSPYSSRNGGPIDTPQEFYTNPVVRKLYQQKLRYILARWGYSTNVFAWELINEADLASFYRTGNFPDISAEFIRDAIRYMRRIHPARHMATSGCYYIRGQWAAPLLSLPEIDFNTGHIFHGDIVEQLQSTRAWMTEKYGKIFLATEAGLTPFAQDPDLTAINIRKTLWGSYMMPYAGAASPWWWVLIDQRDLYPQFKALAAYADGEDRRGKELANATTPATDTQGRRSLSAICLKNKTQVFCWIYDPVAFTTNYKWSLQISGAASLSVPDLEDGAYRLQFWDTVKGRITEERDVKVAGGTVTLQTPPFTSDIALKLFKPPPAETEPAAPGAAAPAP